MTNSLVSVIIPVYKVEKYLNQCVDSVLAQTYQNIEIILVDDGSPDNSGAICDDYAATDARIKVIHKENGGLSSARNAGLKIAKGEWISFVDSDDWVSFNCFERMIACAKKEDANIVMCDFIRTEKRVVVSNIQIMCDQTMLDYALYTERQAARYLLDRWVVWNAIYHRDVIENIFFDNDLRWSEDRMFNYRVLTRQINNLRCCHLHEQHYYYWKNLNGQVRVLRDPTWRTALIDGCFSLWDETQDNYAQFLIGEKCAKAIFVYKYETKFDKTKERHQNLKRYTDALRSQMKKKKWPLAYKVGYRMLLACPWIYIKVLSLCNSLRKFSRIGLSVKNKGEKTR